MLYSLILLIYHAISGLEGIQICFILSLSWKSDLLTPDSLQQNAIDAAIDKWARQLTAYVATDSIRPCKQRTLVVSFS